MSFLSAIGSALGGPIGGAIGGLLEGGSIKSAIGGLLGGMGGLGGIFAKVFGGKPQQTALFSLLNSVSEQAMKSASKN
ncbi:MAG: hypothetical protein V3V19_10860 [Cocleimonas sp.]